MVRVILVSEGTPAHAETICRMALFPEAGAPIPMETARARFDPVVDCEDPGLAEALDHFGPRAALLIRDFTVLTVLQERQVAANILFAPGRLAVLDAMAENRITLRTVAALEAGHCLSEEDVGLERNGPGLGIDLQSHVIGRRLAYPLASGAPIDFGMLV